MATETLNNVAAFTASKPSVSRLTYSISPNQPTVATQESTTTSPELESFLEQENPLGCFRGVMWVMAFNAAAFLLGFMVWRTCKFLW